MDILSELLKNKKLNPSKLVPFGFVQRDGFFEYKKNLSPSQMELTVSVSFDGKISAEIIDTNLCEPYTLHLFADASGGFVGAIRRQFVEALTEISNCCFEPNVFKSAQAKALIDFVAKKYGDDLEFLWDKFPHNAIWRRKDTKKWYGILLTVSKRKLGLKSDDRVEIIDLRVKPDQLTALVDGKTYFLGYHMNKKNWATIILDGSVSFEEICLRIDDSFLLAL